MSSLLSWLAPSRSVPKSRRTRLLLAELEDRCVPTLLGQQLLPADNPWNQQISSAPVAANSAAILNNITSHFGNGRLHPDFGQDYHDGSDLYGIPYNVVHGNSTPRTRVVIDAYPDESDLQDVPLPGGVVIEGDFQNGPRAGVANRGDSHLLVYDQDNNVAYEFFAASRPSENADGQWHADQETVWDMKANTFRTLGYTSADAAGLSLLVGLVRPDEALPVSQGGQGVIKHAIRFTLQNSIVLNQFLYPASHVANPGNLNPAIQPAMGARFRLKAGVDISQLNPEAKVIAQAMKDYGMIVADNGSNFFFSGSSYAVDGNNAVAQTWDDNDMQDLTHGLKSLHFSDFEVVDLTPAVTGLSIHSGPAGTSVTITGHGFSGAAGHLHVFFGTVAASSVTVVDDGHVTAKAPAGTGTVDVCVQSGATVAASSLNVKNTIFGYGTSPANANDRFTFTPPNQAPTVAIAAHAVPAIVAGKRTSLGVVGRDDGGELKLTYTWSVVAKPAGAADPTFSLNGTNAAKYSVVSFTRAGSYTLRATITDAFGLSVTSDVTVTVKQILTKIINTPALPTVAVNSLTQFSASALDQFGDALAIQPIFTWLTNGGRVSKTGLYTAPARAGGPYLVNAWAGGLVGSAHVRVV